MSARKLADSVQFKLIISKDLRRRLERAARKNRLTANQEAVNRLENDLAGAREVERNSDDVLTIMLGGIESAELLRRLAWELMKNPNWSDSTQGREEMIGQMKAALDTQLNLVKIGRGEIKS